jgi:hypothetical protein
MIARGGCHVMPCNVILVNGFPIWFLLLLSLSLVLHCPALGSTVFVRSCNGVKSKGDAVRRSNRSWSVSAVLIWLAVQDRQVLIALWSLVTFFSWHASQQIPKILSLLAFFLCYTAVQYITPAEAGIAFFCRWSKQQHMQRAQP